jgi:DNA-binding transcriptional LysR family regulator
MTRLMLTPPLGQAVDVVDAALGVVYHPPLPRRQFAGLVLLLQPARPRPQLVPGLPQAGRGGLFVAASIASQVIGTDEMALVVRSGHPLTAGPPTIEQVADAVHIVLSRRGLLRGPVDTALEAHGLRRRIAAALPSFAAALAIVEGSDHVCVLPRRLGVPHGRPLVPLALPFPLRSVPAVVSWHHRHDTDPAHRWLRSLVSDIVAGRLDAPTG